MRVVTCSLLCFALLAVSANSSARFERTYSPRGPAHLSISNINGSIRVIGWDRKSIVARANADPSISIEDQVVGDDITLTTRRRLSLGRANFEVSVPPETSLAIKNVIGRIELQNIIGHVSVNSIDSDVHLVGIDSPSVDVRVTSGDIYFDGKLDEAGSYNLQSMRGDVDVTLPSA